MMLYECPTHRQKFEIGAKEECEICLNILKRIAENSKHERVHIPKLRMPVYWGKDADALSQGRVIENLGHRPQHFRNKDQLRDFLKRNRIQEAG